MVTVEKILLEFDPQEINLLPALKKISVFFGFISKKNAEKVAVYFSLPLSRIYETASFYDLLRINNPARVIIQVCSGTNCAVNNSLLIIKAIENYLKIKAGDDFDPRKKLEIISCLGQCGDGPIMVVNGKIFEKVTVSAVYRILREYL